MQTFSVTRSITVEVKNLVVTSTSPSHPAYLKWDPETMTGVTLGCQQEAAPKFQTDVTYRILDPVSHSEVRQHTQQQVCPGSDSWTWDGLDTLGQPVAAGIYVYEIIATDYPEGGAFAQWDWEKSNLLSVVEASQELVSYDDVTAQGVVRVRYRLQDGRDATACQITVIDPDLNERQSVLAPTQVGVVHTVDVNVTLDLAGPWLFLIEAVDDGTTRHHAHRNRRAIQRVAARRVLRVTISFPENGARFKQGVNVIVKGSVQGAINPTTVRIYVNESLKGQCEVDASGNWKFTSHGPPWGWDTRNSSRGGYVIRAVAEDSSIPNNIGHTAINVVIFKMIWPVGISNDVTSEFGLRGTGFHYGIDIACAAGARIQAVEDGQISDRLNDPDGYGWWRIVNHGTVFVELVDGSATLYKSRDISTRYAHLNDSVDPSGGSSLSQGETVGHEGHSGNSRCNHLHFEVREGGTAVNPRNYLP